MSQYWESLASRTEGQHTSDELEAAAYRLACEQVIYYADRGSRSAYHAIERYEREFSRALEPLGIEIKVNRQLLYACALPRHAKSGSASVAQTLFALVLRAIYDEAMNSGRQDDHGEVVCDLIELDEKYRMLCGREFPSKGRLDALMETMKRWGVARKSDEAAMASGDTSATGQPYAVIIRPAIADVLGETALARLGQFKSTAATAAGGGTDDESASEDNNDNKVEV